MSSSKILPNNIRVLDGGFSTQLINYVEKIDGHPLWTAKSLIDNPEAIIQTHLDFLNAGATVISTNTYQASVEGLMKYGGLSEAESFSTIRNAVELAKEARRRFLESYEQPSKKSSKELSQSVEIPEILIAGSCGSYGAFLHDGSEYRGDFADKVTEKFLKTWHRSRVQTLIDGKVDLLAFETIPCLKEAKAILELLKEYPSVKFWISFSCKDCKSISNGELFSDVAEECFKINPELLAIGANCTNPKYIEDLFEGLQEKGIPLVVYPNSGEVYENFTWIKKDEVPFIEDYIEKWLDLGVKWIGGCCRCDAKRIAIIREKVDDWLQKHDN